VDGNSPQKEQNYLQSQSSIKEFQLIRVNAYLFPNQARNIGLRQVDTQYVVFIDNDVIVSPDWLKNLVQCAEDTNATVVGPLVCHYQPVHEIIHCAGGEAHIFIDNQGKRKLRSKLHLQGQKVADTRPKLSRCQTEHAEFHCVLIRKDIFDKVGYFDEAMLNTQEHFDFSMTVRAAGGTIYLEPDSIVTYIPAIPSRWVDIYYYTLRWNDTWAKASVERLQEKWNLSDSPALENKTQAGKRRRRITIIKPLSRTLGKGRLDKPIRKILNYLDKLLNYYIAQKYQQSLIRTINNSFVNQSPSFKKENIL
jgi:GT2 family glycosyltransferase